MRKGITLVVGGAASAAYGAVLDEIGALRLDNLEDFRKHLVTFRRGRRYAQMPG